MVDILKRDVPTEGSSEPLLCGWAEAPGKEEMKAKQPLTPSGPSGKIWNRLLYILGIRRRYAIIGNVCETQLPGNNTDVLWKVTPRGNFKCHDDWYELAGRFRQHVLEQPCNLHFLIGETPVVAFLGASYAGRFQQIRGHPFFEGEKVIIPINHPASALPGRTPSNYCLMFFDMHKGLEIAKNGRNVKPFQIWIPGRNWVEHRL